MSWNRHSQTTEGFLRLDHHRISQVGSQASADSTNSLFVYRFVRQFQSAGNFGIADGFRYRRSARVTRADKNEQALARAHALAPDQMTSLRPDYHPYIVTFSQRGVRQTLIQIHPELQPCVNSQLCPLSGMVDLLDRPMHQVITVDDGGGVRCQQNFISTNAHMMRRCFI